MVVEEFFSLEGVPTSGDLQLHVCAKKVTGYILYYIEINPDHLFGGPFTGATFFPETPKSAAWCKALIAAAAALLVPFIDFRRATEDRRRLRALAMATSWCSGSKWASSFVRSACVISMIVSRAYQPFSVLPTDIAGERTATANEGAQTYEGAVSP